MDWDAVTCAVSFYTEADSVPICDSLPSQTVNRLIQIVVAWAKGQPVE
jgi:hypothetical protein